MHGFIPVLLLTATISSFSDIACTMEYLPSSDQSSSLPYVTEYYGECSESAQCEWLGENSECNYVCRCKEGYQWLNGQCTKYVGLGEVCTDSSECYDGYNLQALTCKDNKCSCSDEYYQRGDTDCRKIALDLGDLCALNIDCKAANSICHLGKCIDSSAEVTLSRQQVTLPKLVSYKSLSVPINCTDDTSCTIPHSECYANTGTCICKRQYFLNKEGTECIPEIGLDFGCKADSDCQIKPGKCIDGACYCRDYYFIDEAKRNCIKTISEENHNCLSKEWCYAFGWHSHCSSNGTCACDAVASFEESNEVCLWSGTVDENACSFDSECLSIVDSACIDETCACKEGFELDGDTCYPTVVGAKCRPENGCHLENSECVDGFCQCQDFYEELSDRCVPKEGELGGNCSEGVCKTQWAKCLSNNTCACDDGFIRHEATCYEMKEYSDYCNNQLECTLSLGKTFQCRNRKCSCPTGQFVDGDLCTSGAGIPRNLKFLSFVIISFLLLYKQIDL